MNQDLLYKYFKGNATIEEEKQILDWVDASDENRKTFQKERMLYDIALFSNEKQSIHANNKARIIPMLKWTTRIAAMIAIVWGGWILVQRLSIQQTGPTTNCNRSCWTTGTNHIGRRYQSMVKLPVYTDLCQ